jgi:transcriptional regulator with XRE-family HTH domain
VAEISFGEWLRHQRRAQGWTQKELALQLHCSISAIRKLESEDRRPSAQVVERLAEILNVAQNHRQVFLRFARGDWRASMPAEIKEALPPISYLDPRWNSPESILSFGGSPEAEVFLQFAWESPNMAEKLILLRQALERAESTEDVRSQLATLWPLGWLDQTNRFQHWEKALSLARQLGDVHELAGGLSTAGLFLALNGDLNTAQKYLAEADALYQQMQRKPVLSHLLSAYGQVSLIQGDLKKARAYLEQLVKSSLEHGSRQDYLWSLVRLGYVALYEGTLEEACSILVQCAREFRKDRIIIGVVFTLEGLAALLTETGKHSQAVSLLGWADSTREKISDRRPLLEQTSLDTIVAVCRARLGQSGFSKAYENGQKMSLEEAVRYALREH